jgi:hypothetical protein
MPATSAAIGQAATTTGGVAVAVGPVGPVPLGVEVTFGSVLLGVEVTFGVGPVGPPLSLLSLSPHDALISASAATTTITSFRNIMTSS